MPSNTDNAGNTPSRSKPVTLLATNQTFSDWVGDTDPNDYYRFSVTAPTLFTLSLNGLTNNADADVAILNSTRARVAVSANGASANEIIPGIELAIGSYYILVYRYAGNTDYNLTFSSSAIPLDYAGNSAANARQVLISSSPAEYRDWIGRSDANDYYSFTITERRTSLNVLLYGLSCGTDVRLLNSSLYAIVSHTNDQYVSESIQQNNLPAGTYYIQVSRNSGETNYNLIISSNPEISLSGNDTVINNNSMEPSLENNTNFGIYFIGNNPTRRFVISNIGTGNLTISNLSISGQLRASERLTPSIQPGGSDSFTIGMQYNSIGSKTGSVTLQTNDSDESQFTFSVKGSVIHGFYTELALLSMRAYTPSWAENEVWPYYTNNLLPGQFNSITSRWQPLTNDELNSKGVFLTSGTLNNDGYYINDNQAVWVGVSRLLGEETLIISFRGTDDWMDAIDYISFLRSYNSMIQPIVSAVDQYVGYAGIQNVLVTGHSMGGSMAMIYMDQHQNTPSVRYSGATFGAAGIAPGAAIDTRLIAIWNTQDGIQETAHLLGGYTINNPKLSIVSAATSPIVDNMIAEHSLWLYCAEMWALEECPGQNVLSYSPFLSGEDSSVHIGYYNTSNSISELNGDVFGIDDPANLVGGIRDDRINGGSKNDWICGLAGNDTILGRAGNDTLIGGQGNDTLTGGNNADSFKFILPTDGNDTITDFSVSQGDKLVFVSPNFGNLSVGSLATTRLRLSSTGNATSTSQRFLFNTSRHLLTFDPDGSGPEPAVSIATLNNISSLSVNQILMVAR